MIVTEEEAKNKWCPEARVGVYAGNGGVPVNRNPETEDETRCIGSACMMWRWQDSKSHAEDRGPNGYCGKAGRP